METFVLDTNVLIRDSTIIERWSPNFRIIIPAVIFSELDRVLHRLQGQTGKFWETLELAKKSGFVKVVENQIDTENKQEQYFDKRLSPVDIQIFELCKTLSKKDKNVILVTDDRPLKATAELAKIKTLNFYQFQNHISDFKTTTINQLKKNETIKHYQTKRFIYGFTSGIILSFAIILVIKYFEQIYNTLNIWSSIISVLLAGIVFFIFRLKARMFYGLLEFGFGALICIRALSISAFHFNSLDIVDMIQIIAGIYVMVRGLTNIDEGIKGTIIEPFWIKVTRW